MKKFQTTIATIIVAVVMSAALSASAAEPKQQKSQVVNINTATVTELAFLPGVGESKATAIIKHRERRPFKKIEDIVRVKGIGRKSFKKMRAYLSISGATTATAKIKIPK